MRTLTKLLLMVSLALTVSTSAGAVVSIGLVQVGGTYSATVGPQAGDTLVLNITYGLQPGDAVTLVDAGLVWDSSVTSFTGGTETAFAAWSAGAVALNPIATGDIGLVTPTQADGWEKATTLGGGGSSPCVFGACTSLGTASFVLSGNGGSISIGAVGVPFGTVIGDGTFQDITASSSLGTFTMIPEPTTASLLGLGLLGLTVAGRRRKK
jgi:hypothetical protein